MPNPGFSNGDAINAIREVAAETLPQGYTYEFAGMTREEAQSSPMSTAIVFGLCLLFVYCCFLLSMKVMHCLGRLSSQSHLV